MNELKDWCINIIDNKEAEPNSILSTEIMYLLNHWDGLTSFLSIEGAELDNNQLEQKLRLSVLNRKNNEEIQNKNYDVLISDLNIQIMTNRREAVV